MMYLADAFHLDQNTRVLLAYYDARTLEDFCCMTQVDFDELKLSAECLNRALPPLQIRKIQVLREWVQGLANKASKTPLWELGMPDRVKLIPKDWKKQFKEALPDLKQDLKKRGERWTNSCPSFAWMFCWQ